MHEESVAIPATCTGKRVRAEPGETAVRLDELRRRKKKGRTSRRQQACCDPNPPLQPDVVDDQGNPVPVFKWNINNLIFGSTNVPYTHFDTIMMPEMLRFFQEERVRKLVVPLAVRQSPLSLRNLETFVCNMATELNLWYYYRYRDGRKALIDINTVYADTMSINNRKGFDVVRRDTRVYVRLPEDPALYSTTVPQLCMVKRYWETGILQLAILMEPLLKQWKRQANQRLKREKEKNPGKRIQHSRRPRADLCVFRSPSEVPDSEFIDELDNMDIVRYGVKALTPEQAAKLAPFLALHQQQMQGAEGGSRESSSDDSCATTS